MYRPLDFIASVYGAKVHVEVVFGDADIVVWGLVPALRLTNGQRRGFGLQYWSSYQRGGNKGHRINRIEIPISFKSC